IKKREKKINFLLSFFYAFYHSYTECVLQNEKVDAWFRSILLYLKFDTQNKKFMWLNAVGAGRVFRFSDDHSSAEKSGRQWPTSGTNFRCDSKNERATGTAGRTSKLNP
ncbi:hypothetical protein P4412_33125, partial [Bacillus thuringiensis]|nr:hypothetical protein [Bacillus thuringiensis]